jgi:vacuolar-type H+-ATPase catalytic subunit A/Vma1
MNKWDRDPEIDVGHKMSQDDIFGKVKYSRHLTEQCKIHVYNDVALQVSMIYNQMLDLWIPL